MYSLCTILSLPKKDTSEELSHSYNVSNLKEVSEFYKT